LEGLAIEDVGIHMYLMASWSILRPFGIFSGYLVYLRVIWYSVFPFGMLNQEKSGNPDGQPRCFFDAGYLPT
jgi:hypothetical protein